MRNTLEIQHLEDLRRSGLTDETIQILGFYSGTAQETELVLGFSAGPGLIIPYPRYDKTALYCRVKPNTPPIFNRKPAKYLSPKGVQVKAYIPPRTKEALKNPKTWVILTEGEKKAAKADQEGFACIGLAGIWGFSQKHKLIPDLS
jgi:putative DNA primase/helicase